MAPAVGAASSQPGRLGRWVPPQTLPPVLTSCWVLLVVCGPRQVPTRLAKGCSCLCWLLRARSCKVGRRLEGHGQCLEGVGAGRPGVREPSRDLEGTTVLGGPEPRVQCWVRKLWSGPASLEDALVAGALPLSWGRGWRGGGG